ncbi:hypothetical protein RUM43_007707 [Polyplax serrata]|uniref:Uncharacterized protein n=1 Tax=Polyplax serrata TaxID=468196 RepID=A0AAN8P6A1_POLSC
MRVEVALKCRREFAHFEGRRLKTLGFYFGLLDEPEESKETWPTKMLKKEPDQKAVEGDESRRMEHFLPKKYYQEKDVTMGRWQQDKLRKRRMEVVVAAEEEAEVTAIK